MLNGLIDRSIQEAYAFWADRIPPAKLHGGVLAPEVRNGLLYYCSRPKAIEAMPSIHTVEGPNRSAVITVAGGEQARVRKHPVRTRTGELRRPVQPQIMTLFGVDPSAAPWEYWILWAPDFKTQTLQGSWLAAVADGDSSSVMIYDKVALPPARMISLEERPRRDDDLGWDDFFEEGTGDIDPA